LGWHWGWREVLCSVMPTGRNTDRVESVNDSSGLAQVVRKAMAVTICLLLLTLGLMKPALRSHHFSPSYRRTCSSREAARHTLLDVSDQAPDIRTVELGRDVARHLLIALDAGRHLAHPLPL
jgi:hypothetical protein